MPEEDPIHPTSRLVEYYKEKLREWRKKYADLLNDVEACKDLANRSAAKEEAALRILAEASELQESLSDLRQCLYKEREHVLRLTRDNDDLELLKLEDRKKINFLLDLCGLKESDISLNEGDKKRIGIQARRRVRFKEVANFNRNLKEFREESLIETLHLKVSSLEAQLQEQTEHLRDEIGTLTDDFELRKGEWEVQKKRLMQQVSCLNCRLKNAQMFKFQEMTSYLDELDKDRERDIQLIEENDRLRRSLAICRELLGPDFPEEDKTQKHESGLRLLREQIEQRDRIIEGYVEQGSTLTEQISMLRAELVAEKEARLKERERLIDREEYYKKKMEEEKKRRQLESEGFTADVKLLRGKLQSLERQVRQEQLRRRHALNSA